MTCPPRFPESLLMQKFSIITFFQKLEGFGETLSQYMTTISAYFQTRRLKLNHSKTVMSKICNNNRLLPFCPTPTYFGVKKLDRSLMFCHHLLALCKKTILMRHTVEATCRLRVRCWCQNTTHCSPISGFLNSCILHTSLVSQGSLAS